MSLFFFPNPTFQEEKGSCKNLTLSIWKEENLKKRTEIVERIWKKIPDEEEPLYCVQIRNDVDQDKAL